MQDAVALAEQSSSLPPSPPKSQTVAALPHPLSANNVPLTNDPSLTPPSSSAVSSEDQQPISNNVVAVFGKGGEPVAVNSARSSRSPTESPIKEGAREMWSGPKRTATGQVKRSSITSLNDLRSETNGTRPSRTSSLLSNGSNGSVMEASQACGSQKISVLTCK